MDNPNNPLAIRDGNNKLKAALGSTQTRSEPDFEIEICRTQVITHVILQMFSINNAKNQTPIHIYNVGI